MEHYDVENYLFGRKKTPRLTAKFIFLCGKVQNNNINFSMEILIRNLGRIMAKCVLCIVSVKGLNVVSPLPTGFILLKSDLRVTNLQYGPYAGVMPNVVMPNPSGQERWTTIGKLTLQIQNKAQPGFISYSLLKRYYWYSYYLSP